MLHIHANRAQIAIMNSMSRMEIVTSRISIDNVWQRTDRKITTNYQRVTSDNSAGINGLTETVQKLKILDGSDVGTSLS